MIIHVTSLTYVSPSSELGYLVHILKHSEILCVHVHTCDYTLIIKPMLTC